MREKQGGLKAKNEGENVRVRGGGINEGDLQIIGAGRVKCPVREWKYTGGGSEKN